MVVWIMLSEGLQGRTNVYQVRGVVRVPLEEVHQILFTKQSRESLVVKEYLMDVSGERAGTGPRLGRTVREFLRQRSSEEVGATPVHFFDGLGFFERIGLAREVGAFLVAGGGLDAAQHMAATRLVESVAADAPRYYVHDPESLVSALANTRAMLSRQYD